MGTKRTLSSLLNLVMDRLNCLSRFQTPTQCSLRCLTRSTCSRTSITTSRETG